MLKPTHISLACAASLAFCPAPSVPILVAGTAAAALGGVLPDIDADQSGAHRESNKVIALSVLLIGSVALLDHLFQIGIYERLVQNASLYQIYTGFIVMLVICAFGKAQPHRSFMHSFFACCLLSACVRMMFPSIAKPFAVGFLTHLAADLLNRKGERLLWPSGKGFCLRLCRSDGTVNQILFMLGILISFLLLIKRPLTFLGLIR